MTAQNQKAMGYFSLLRRCFPMALSPFPLLIALYVAVGICHGTSYVLQTWTTQLFFDAVTQAVVQPTLLTHAILTACLLGGSMILSPILNGVHNFMNNTIVQPKVVGHLEKLLHEKASRIMPISFEDPSFLDDVNKARQGMQQSFGIISIAVTLSCFYLPYFIATGFYLWSVKPLFVIVILLLFLPLLLTQIVRTKIFSELEDHAAPLRRQYEYYDRCITQREFFKETRLLGGFGFFHRLYRDALSLFNAETWKAEKKTGLIEITLKLVTLLGYGGILYLMVTSLLHGEISVGAFSAVFSSLGMIYSIMEEIICRHIGEMTRNVGAVRNFIRYMDMPERQGRPTPPDLSQGIRLDGVSFSYPGSDHDCVRNISLDIRSGETLAIVGENGAGKSTLVRLITGIYTPSQGHVFLGGQDTSQVSLQALFSRTSGVFQRYQQYKMTLRENVQISQTQKPARDSDIAGALHKADLDIKNPSFTQGLDTMLGKEFDGVDLSGGQWQRIAIARGFYRDHDLIVLDEPTAAIDPVEETRIYQKFAEIAQSSTAILVTHRLGSARIADRIAVMDNGRIVELGSHEELMSHCGKYARMFQSQAQYYS